MGNVFKKKTLTSRQSPKGLKGKKNGDSTKADEFILVVPSIAQHS